MTATDVEDRLKNALPEYALPQVLVVENFVDDRDLERITRQFLIHGHDCLSYLHVIDLGDFTRIDAVPREWKNR